MRNLILSALILASALQAAFGQIVEGQWTYIVENGGATITATTETGAVTIPSELGGYAVKRVGDGWPSIFGKGDPSMTINTSVTSIVIPNSVTSFGYSAFWACKGLTSVTIGNGVTSIEDGAFNSCVSLTSIVIPNSVTSIGRAFYACQGLTSVTIGNGVTSIGDFAFHGCNGLTSVTIPNSVTSIGQGAFRSCPNLQRIFLPVRFETTYQDFLTTNGSLTSAEVIFYDASNLASIYLAGQQSVISNPNTHNLYTTSQIQNMAVGDLVLTKNVGGTFTLNYDIEQSTDLQTWTPYQALSLPLTGLTTDKAFVRMKVINSSPNPPPSTAFGGNL
jgi:hypothetical protein